MKLVSILTFMLLVGCGGEVTINGTDSLYGSYNMPSSEVNALNDELTLIGVNYSNVYLKFTRDDVSMHATCNTPDGSRDLDVSSAIIVRDDYYEILYYNDTKVTVGDYQCDLAIWPELVEYSFNGFGDLVLTPENSVRSLTLRER